MVICAQQPIPENYSLESVTSSPSCECLGQQDNAYVIRLNATASKISPGAASSEPFETDN
jgi:hypothetical protein